VTRGWTVPSTRWYFAVGDLSAVFDTSYAIFNPSDQDTVVDAEFLFADRDPSKRSIPVPAKSRMLVRPRQLGIGGDSIALFLHARGGVGVIAERTVDTITRSGAWRQSAVGATAAGTRWVFAEAHNGPDTDILIANPSDVSGRARLHFHTKYSYGSDVVKVVDVPARRVVRVPTTDGPFFGGSWLVVTSEATTASPPPLVVERVSYVDVDDMRRARQATIFGNLQ
jgi:hypothetical protein